jgi:hypothetical protein
VKRREPKGPASCADGEVCSNPPSGKKKTLAKAGVVRDTALIRWQGVRSRTKTDWSRSIKFKLSNSIRMLCTIKYLTRPAAVAYFPLNE